MKLGKSVPRMPTTSTGYELLSKWDGLLDVRTFQTMWPLFVFLRKFFTQIDKYKWPESTVQSCCKLELGSHSFPPTQHRKKKYFPTMGDPLFPGPFSYIWHPATHGHHSGTSSSWNVRKIHSTERSSDCPKEILHTNPRTQDNEFFLDYKLGNSGHGRIEFGRGIW